MKCKMKCLGKCMPCLRRMKKAGVPDPCCVPMTLRCTARIISVIEIGIGCTVLIIFSFISIRAEFTNGIGGPTRDVKVLKDFLLFLIGIIFYIIVSIFLLEFTTKDVLVKWISWAFMVLSAASYVILHMVLIDTFFEFFGQDYTASVRLLEITIDIFHVYALWVVIAFMRALMKGMADMVKYKGPICKEAPSLVTQSVKSPVPSIKDNRKSSGDKPRKTVRISTADTAVPVPIEDAAAAPSSKVKIPPIDGVDATTSSLF